MQKILAGHIRKLLRLGIDIKITIHGKLKAVFNCLFKGEL